MKKIALIALMAGTAMAANAKDSLGTLSNVKGNISISGAGYVSKAVNGTPLLEGSKVLVSNNAKATVVLANGCSVPLTSGQHLTVTSALTCAQLQASVKELFTPYRVAAVAGTGAAGTTGTAGAAGAGAAGAGVAGGVAAGATTAAVVGGMAVAAGVAAAAVNQDEVTSP